MKTKTYLALVVCAVLLGCGDNSKNTGAGGDAGQEPSPCEGIDCSGHGACDDATGVASCVCDDGFEPSGSECVPLLADRAHFVATSGSDAASGTVDEPWRTLAYAFGRLAAGDTLYLRGGTYYEEAITTSLAGTAEAPITIRSYPGELAVIDGGIPDYKNVPNDAWEVVDGSIGLYRTRNTHSGEVGAWLIEDDTQLIQYTDAENLQATNYVLNGGDLYFGPGVQLRDDGKVYIRLEPNTEDLWDADHNPIPPVPLDPDPRHNAISVFITPTLFTLEGAAYLRFEGLTFQYARRIMEWRDGTHDITLTNCRMSFGTIGILARDASTADIAGCEFNNGVPMTMYWTDVKNREPEDGIEVEPQPQPEFQSGALVAVSNMTVRGCTFRRSFDAISVPPGGIANVTIRDNYFRDIKDDSINLSLDNDGIEIAHNLFWHCHSGISLFQHTGTAGDVFIHHNVFDGSLLTRTGRPGNFRDSSYPPWAGGNPFSGHDGRSQAHWAIYNNTFISRQARTATAAMSPDGVLGNPRKYLYNNVFYAHDDRIVLRDDGEASGSHYDGNVFWQATPGTMFANFADGRDYGSLAALRASGTAWEASGLQTHPGLDAAVLLSAEFDAATMWHRYVPTNFEVLGPGVNLADLGWPESTGISYRGALPGD